MPLLGFQKQFVPLVESGVKRQTIRATRKLPFKVGDRLFLYSSLRTKQCRKLGEATCISVSGVRITHHGIGFEMEDGRFVAHLVDGPEDGPDGVRECEMDAVDDGFDSFAEMLEWFEKTHGLPFEGQLIQWGEIERCP